MIVPHSTNEYGRERELEALRPAREKIYDSYRHIDEISDSESDSEYF